jgi:hypothetical protein
MTPTRDLRKYAIAAITTMLAASTALGAPTTPTITAASVDSALAKLTIQGTGLGTTANATVTLDGYPNPTLSGISVSKCEHACDHR